ncbi:Hypothetical predicted protein [Octopus vulgaris]|uniref:Uncharacterized protein n=1 Tax=Octopus vulgaris TaxID=6645 RepID=A0AA36B259_OCTVU|nr:Hypothetical predicted protein [Octopus vulgaris]
MPFTKQMELFPRGKGMSPSSKTPSSNVENDESEVEYNDKSDMDSDMDILVVIFIWGIDHLILVWHNLPQRLDQLTPKVGKVKPFGIHLFKGHSNFQCENRKLELATNVAQGLNLKNWRSGQECPLGYLERVADTGTEFQCTVKNVGVRGESLIDIC